MARPGPTGGKSAGSGPTATAAPAVAASNGSGGGFFSSFSRGVSSLLKDATAVLGLDDAPTTGAGGAAAAAAKSKPAVGAAPPTANSSSTGGRATAGNGGGARNSASAGGGVTLPLHAAPAGGGGRGPDTAPQSGVVINHKIQMFQRPHWEVEFVEQTDWSKHSVPHSKWLDLLPDAAASAAAAAAAAGSSAGGSGTRRVDTGSWQHTLALLHVVTTSMTHPTGAFITPAVFVPRQVWALPGAAGGAGAAGASHPAAGGAAAGSGSAAAAAAGGVKLPAFPLKLQSLLRVRKLLSEFGGTAQFYDYAPQPMLKLLTALLAQFAGVQNSLAYQLEYIAEVPIDSAAPQSAAASSSGGGAGGAAGPGALGGGAAFSVGATPATLTRTDSSISSGSSAAAASSASAATSTAAASASTAGALSTLADRLQLPLTPLLQPPAAATAPAATATTASAANAPTSASTAGVNSPLSPPPPQPVPDFDSMLSSSSASAVTPLAAAGGGTPAVGSLLDDGSSFDVVDTPLAVRNSFAPAHKPASSGGSGGGGGIRGMRRTGFESDDSLPSKPPTADAMQLPTVRNTRLEPLPSTGTSFFDAVSSVAASAVAVVSHTISGPTPGSGTGGGAAPGSGSAASSHSSGSGNNNGGSTGGAVVAAAGAFFDRAASLAHDIGRGATRFTQSAIPHTVTSDELREYVHCWLQLNKQIELLGELMVQYTGRLNANTAALNSASQPSQSPKHSDAVSPTARFDVDPLQLSTVDLDREQRRLQEHRTAMDDRLPIVGVLHALLRTFQFLRSVLFTVLMHDMMELLVRYHREAARSLNHLFPDA